MSNETAFAEIAHAIASIINFEMPVGFSWPGKWTHIFRVLEPEPGARVIVKEGADLEIRKIHLHHLANSIVQWSRLQSDPEALMTFRKSKEVAEIWRAIAEPLDPAHIKNVRWKSEPGYTWRRLPWDMQDGPTPYWDKIFAKLSNASAMRQFIGSLFFDEAKQHQYVWAHGLGGDGKGSLNRFLKRAFGPSYRSKQPPQQNDKFWTHGLIGARLVVFPDCNSQGFTSGGLFKTLSGGDPVDAEAKNEMSFTTELCAKFMFLSNEKPNISCEEADMRRIIYCEFFEKTKKEDKNPEFEKKLWGEGGYFLTKCVREYIAHCPNHEDIVSSKEEIESWVSVNDEKFQDVFDQYFMQPKHEPYQRSTGLLSLSVEDLGLVSLLPRELLAVVTGEFKDHKDQRRFRDWLYKKYNVQKVSMRRPGIDPFYRYVGIHRLLTKDAAAKLSRKIALLKNSPLSTVDSPVDTISN